MTQNRKYDSNDVSMPVPAYNDFMQVLDLPHSLMGGTKVMRDKGQTYLPKEKAEKQESYNNRLKRSFLKNNFRRTIQKLSGEVFSSKIDIPEEYPEDLKEWLKNIDLQKNDLTTFSKSLFEDGIVDGIVHALVELPRIETVFGEDNKLYFKDVNENTGESVLRVLTREVMKNKGWRPYVVIIDASSLIGWRFRKSDEGEPILSQIRILESSEEEDGKYGVREVKRIRVIEEDFWELFELQKNSKDEDEWVLIDSGQHNRGYIALESWILGKPTGEMTVEPPMEDLAYLNLAHWQSSSDQRNILHFARMITYFGKRLGLKDTDSTVEGNEGGEQVMGANVLVHSNDVDSDLKVVEHSGKAIESGRDDLKDLEVSMRAYGLGLIMGQKTGTVTATEKAIDTAESDSTAISWAISFEAFLNRIVKRMYQMAGNDIELPECKVNTDFKSFLRGMEVKELREAFLDGILPKEVVFNEYQRRGIIKDNLDFADVITMMSNEQNNYENFS